MKLFVTLFVCLFINSLVNSQDRLVKINGDTLTIKINKITPTEIEYIDTASAFIQRKIDKSEIAFIHYENGIKEVFSSPLNNNSEINIESNYAFSHEYPILKIDRDCFFVDLTEYDLKRILRIMADLNNDELDKLIRKIRINKTIYEFTLIGTAPIGGVSLILLIYNVFPFIGGDNDPSVYNAIKVLSAIDVGLFSTSIYLKRRESKNVKKAISLYNTLIKEIPN